MSRRQAQAPKRSTVSARVRTLSLATLVQFVLTGVVLTGVVWALPPGRHYELVSPPYKGGYGVAGLDSSGAIEAVAPSGESVGFGSLGAFAGAPSNRTFTPYLAHRDPTAGWRTTPLATPAANWPQGYAGILDFSSNLETSLAFGRPGANFGAAESEGTENEFLLHATDAPDVPEAFAVAGGVLSEPANITLNYRSGSADLSHLILKPNPRYPLVPEAVGIETPFGPPYDFVTRGGGEHPLRLIDLDNGTEPKPISLVCETRIGGMEEPGKGSAFGALAMNGREIFFVTGMSNAVREVECNEHNQLFVRLDGARTLEVSRPLTPGEPYGGCVGEAAGHVPGEVPCKGATTRAAPEFAGASEDGSRVFFTTAAQLSAEDKDTQNDLYMATIGCPLSEPGCPVSGREVISIVQVSHDPNVGEVAGVQGVVAMNPDGSRVYFVAHGALGEGSNAEGRAPVAGADNLYVYERDAAYPAGRVVFVADLCSGPRLSGGVTDPLCPASLASGGEHNDSPLWASGVPEAQTTGTGGFLVFSSYGQLLPGDTDNAKDVYRYDAQTGALERVSVGQAGYDANGNCDDGVNDTRCDAMITAGPFSKAGGHVAKEAELDSRAISEDGSRIVFTTAEGLSAAATNKLVDAYEWHEGAVSLVSTGGDEQAVTDVVIDPSGRDVFFTTVQGLVAQDTDGVADVYDARLGAGFASEPAPVRPCEGDACQGPLSNPAPLLVPGSAVQAPGGNLPAPSPTPTIAKKTKAKAKAKVKAKARVKRSKRGRSSTRGHLGSARKSSGRRG